MLTPKCAFPLAVTLAVAFTASCGDDSVSDPNDLAGREFLLESSAGYVPVDGTTIRLSFDESEFGFSAGCNSHSGPYSLSGGQLCLQGLSSTEIGCDAALQAQDEFLAEFFTSKPGLELDGDQLTVTGSDVTFIFLDREVADPDRPLTGRTWSIDTFIEAGGASNFPLQVAPTVSFDEAGTLEVFTTCATGDGSYVVNGQDLLLSDVNYTEEACGPSGSDAADASIKAVLTDGQVSFTIEAARLTILRGDLGLSATTE